jgi:cytochrome oxidase Cu insertion factor (SCO1/SenC/PrrC family)
VTRGGATVSVALAAIAGVAAGVLVHALRAHASAPALPALHGQAVWSEGERPAPNFSLRDQAGALVSLRSQRGHPVLLTFLDSRCRSSCPVVGRQLGSVLRRLPAAKRPVLMIVSVNPAGDNAETIHLALAKWQLAGPWTTHWLSAPSRAQLAPVWRSYGIAVARDASVHTLSLYLIDRHGDERTAYLFPFLPAFVQHDLAVLAS